MINKDEPLKDLKGLGEYTKNMGKPKNKKPVSRRVVQMLYPKYLLELIELRGRKYIQDTIKCSSGGLSGWTIDGRCPVAVERWAELQIKVIQNKEDATLRSKKFIVTHQDTEECRYAMKFLLRTPGVRCIEIDV